MEKQYKVLSRKSCERYCTQNHNKTSIIISISSIWDKVKPDVYINDKNNIRDILFLSFDDVDMEEDKRFCMQYEDGKKVADFINKWYDKVDVIIVHCDGGISRSAGVAAAIMRVKEHNDSKYFLSTTKFPNRTCYLKTLEGFNYITKN